MKAESGGNYVREPGQWGPRGSGVRGKMDPPPQVVGILIHHTSASPVLPTGASQGGFKVHEMEGGCLRKAPCQRRGDVSWRLDGKMEGGGKQGS